MQVQAFIHKLLDPVTHIKRVEVLAEVVTAALKIKKLTLTALGREVACRIQERSGIQKVNRLLGNKKISEEYAGIAGAISQFLIGNKQHPQLIIDWTKFPNSQDSILRAALAVEGRALTVYEERHPIKKMGNGKIEKNFLNKLKNIIPVGCKPIIVTDAGFHNNWFREVEKLGWDYIGRIRGKRRCFIPGQEEAIWCSDLFKRANYIASSLGKLILTKKNPFESNCYIVKKKLKGRKALTKQGKVKRDKDSKNYGRSYREPWLLASSLSGRNAAKKVCNMYSRRMTIEEGFRDLKSSQYGLGLEMSKTKIKERRDVLLLIAALTTLIAWVTGYVAEAMGLHYQFQSNSIKHRRVLSLFYLGCQIIKKKIPIPLASIFKLVAYLSMEGK